MKALTILKACRERGQKRAGGLDLDEAISELEEAMKPKSCALCGLFTFDEEFNDGFGQCFYGIHFPNSYSSSYHKGDCNYCSEFKPKDNA